MDGLTRVEEHFSFGENWQSFSRVVNDGRIAAAEDGLKKLFPSGELAGARLLDVGCGSGLSSLAALRLGAASVDAVDIDPASVATAHELLTTYAKPGTWSTQVKSVFDLSPESQFDIVYSWGVLHHTGDMWRAVRTAAAMVRPGGLFAIALYRKTRWCGFWAREKKFYSRSPRVIQRVIGAVYKSLVLLSRLLSRTSPVTNIRRFLDDIRQYHKNRGMSWSHDVHDWLGGYPYESASPGDVHACLRACGFDIVREFLREPGSGVFGSGCDEFVALRRLTPNSAEISVEGRDGA